MAGDTLNIWYSYRQKSSILFFLNHSVYLVLCWPKFIVLFCFLLLPLILMFSVLAERLAVKSDSDISDPV